MLNNVYYALLVNRFAMTCIIYCIWSKALVQCDNQKTFEIETNQIRDVQKFDLIDHPAPGKWVEQLGL